MVEKIRKEQDELYHSALNAEVNHFNKSIVKSRGNSMKLLTKNNMKIELSSDRRKINTDINEDLSEN